MKDERRWGGCLCPTVSAPGIGNPGGLERSSLSAQTSWGVRPPRQLCGLRWQHLHGKRSSLVSVPQPSARHTHWLRPGSRRISVLPELRSRFSDASHQSRHQGGTSNPPCPQGRRIEPGCARTLLPTGLSRRQPARLPPRTSGPARQGDLAAALEWQALPLAQRRDRVTLSARHHD